MTVLLWVLRFVLAAVFGYAGVMKLLDPAAFAVEIGNFRIVSTADARPIAVGLPWLEVLVAGGLLFAATLRPAAFGCVLMLLGFTLAIGYAWWRGLDLACGCFGAGGETSNYAWLLSRNGLLLLAAGYLAVGSVVKPSVKDQPSVVR